MGSQPRELIPPKAERFIASPTHKENHSDRGVAFKSIILFILYDSRGGPAAGQEPHWAFHTGTSPDVLPTIHFRELVGVREPPIVCPSRLHVQVAIEAHGGLLGVIPQVSQDDGRYWESLTIRQLKKENDCI